jgi:hypothetical protein
MKCRKHHFKPSILYHIKTFNLVNEDEIIVIIFNGNKVLNIDPIFETGCHNFQDNLKLIFKSIFQSNPNNDGIGFVNYMKNLFPELDENLENKEIDKNLE